MATRWTVLNQRQESRLTPQGNFTEVMVITFEYEATGQPYDIEVPSRQYNAADVQAKIDAFCDRLDDVRTL